MGIVLNRFWNKRKKRRRKAKKNREIKTVTTHCVSNDDDHTIFCVLSVDIYTWIKFITCILLYIISFWNLSHWSRCVKRHSYVRDMWLCESLECVAVVVVAISVRVWVINVDIFCWYRWFFCYFCMFLAFSTSTCLCIDSSAMSGWPRVCIACMNTFNAWQFAHFIGKIARIRMLSLSFVWLSWQSYCYLQYLLSHCINRSWLKGDTTTKLSGWFSFGIGLHIAIKRAWEFENRTIWVSIVCPMFIYMRPPIPRNYERISVSWNLKKFFFCQKMTVILEANKKNSLRNWNAFLLCAWKHKLRQNRNRKN